MRHFLLLLCALSVLVFSPALIAAQQSAAVSSVVAPRITAPVDDSVLTTLGGGIPGRARATFDLGSAPASAALTSVRLVLSRTPQQEAALEKFMAEQLNPASPNYHKWLTPQQFGRLYGPADTDITALTTWLESQGLTVKPVAPGRTSIAFSGTVAQMEAAFHTEIHSFNDHGDQFLANVSNPKIPSALATVVFGVAQLDTIRPRPTSIRGRNGKLDLETKRLRPMLTVGSGTSTDPYGLYIVPGDAATIYDTPNSYNANFSSTGSSYTGTGVTIGIGGDATIQTGTVLNYRRTFLGDTNVPTITNVSSDPATCTDANSKTCDQDEAYLDNEIAGGLAPGATIHFYTSANLNDAIEQAINDNAVDIFSLSFGNCEGGMSTADNQTIDGWWQQAAAQGIAVTVSTGDSGSAGCDDDNTEYYAQYGLQVSGFASTPYNIAVGGTDFSGLLSSFSTYVSTNESSSGPNTSSVYYRSALSYIPESTWNDSVTSNGLLAQNAPYTDSTTGLTNIVAGSGGASSCSTNSNTGTTFSNCTSGYTKPTWQTGAGVPNDGVRDIPDVSLMAGNGGDNSAWLVCTDDTATSGSTAITTNCAAGSGGEFYFYGFGGTSTSAPAFAGILALVQQKNGSRLGQAAQQLYALYNGTHASAVFHDVTVGNNSVPCTSGTPDCSQNSAGNEFLTGYNTATGYDLATGLGSVDASQLVNWWNETNGTATATVLVSPNVSSANTGTELYVQVTVTGSSGTPTGAVTLSGGGYTSPSVTLVSGNYEFSIDPGSFSTGTDTLTVSYSGDSTYAGATGTSAVTITPATPSVVLIPASMSIPVNTALSVTVNVNGIANVAATGTVSLAAGTYTTTLNLVDGAGTVSIPANSLPVGTDTLTASYNGDSHYTEATGTASVAVTAIYSLSGITPSPISAGGSAGSTITVSTNSGYTGSVALACSLTSSPSSAQNVPTCSVSGSPVTLSSAATSAAATVNFATTAASSAAVPAHMAKSGWMQSGAATLLALLVFFGIPARRRAWRAMLGVFALIAAFGMLSACGGGGGGTGGGNTNPGTTAGNYTFTITGTGNPAISPTPSTTVTLTVN